MNEQENTTIPTCRDVNSAPGNGWRVGNVGLLLIQAAKQGSRDSLEFLFGSVPRGMSIASYKLLFMCWGATLKINSAPNAVCVMKSCGFFFNTSVCTSHAAREQVDYTDNVHSEVSSCSK